MSVRPLARAPRLDGARAVFTTRAGGVSAAPYDTLNLARHVGDSEDAVTANREIVERQIGAPLVLVDQEHGAEVAVLRPGDRPDPSAPRTADALVTDRDDVALAVLVADCVPVLLADAQSGVVAAAHAGRRGLLAGVLQNTVSAMTDLGASPKGIAAVIGPSICCSCYEVPAALRDKAARKLPSTAAATRRGTPAIDLRAGAFEALLRSGVLPAQIDLDQPCTAEDPRLFSYRRSCTTGRTAGVIRRA